MTVIGLCLGGLVFSYLGAVHPAGDVAAIGAPVLGLFGLITALFLRGRLGRACSAIFLIWLGQHAWALFAPTGPAGAFVIYQKNLWAGNADLEPLVKDILASNADVITLQEVSSENAHLLDLLARHYPYQHRCHPNRLIGEAVLSRHPSLPGSQICGKPRGFAAMRVHTGSGPVWVGSLHLTRPFPHNQAERLRDLDPSLARMAGPVVIGADLNMFPATRVSRRVSQLAGARELRPLRPTLWLRSLPMVIDHVYASSGTVERRPLLGSDHYGLLGRVMP